jgi:putative NADH-flavin reductase
MRVVVVGGGGRTGKLVVDALIRRGDTPVATIRSPRQMAELVKAGAEVLMLDLVESEFEQWVHGFRGADAIVFAAGSATGESSALDRKGTLRTVRAAEKAGVDRYVTIASIGASTGMKLSGEWATDEMVDYYKQKRAANKLIRESTLRWTIVEPGELTDNKGTGKARISVEAVKSASISRADVATVVVEALHQPKTAGMAFQVVRGESAIATALAASAGVAAAVPDAAEPDVAPSASKTAMARPAAKAKPAKKAPAVKAAPPAKKAAVAKKAAAVRSGAAGGKAPAKKAPAKKAQPAARAPSRSSSKARSRSKPL